MNETKKKNSTDKFIGHSTSLKAGDKAPDFEAKDQNGSTIRLNDFVGKNLVLYFYPKDDTPTCTKQACNLRDEFSLLSNKNYAVVGVSADSEKSHAKFAKKHALPFPLLADFDMKIIQSYDVWGLKMLFGKIYDGIVRTSFLIDQNGLIKKVIKDVESKNHVGQILSI
ncbi:thioredoxin-dependent thiol peroxidase [Aurantibacillus circumpalustris]|uniref:thioredoxin-dependent thiol peroxidase n=1 Tax=Aurantibacillus circumpalustris TaxID=3036359 RepID=UPI00295AAB9D|nr:thioredoxin-dependent thiol peroxidase [Aurantibacillus circumpalustris]